MLFRSSGGTPRVLLSAESVDSIPDTWMLTPAGSTGQRLLVAQTSCGTQSCWNQLYQVDPVAATASLDSALFMGVVRPATAPAGTLADVSRWLVCAGDCGNGQLQEVQPDGGAGAVLGALGSPRPAELLSGIEGLPLGFAAVATPPAGNRSDAWLAWPGQAGSLTRLTHWLP